MREENEKSSSAAKRTRGWAEGPGALGGVIDETSRSCIPLACYGAHRATVDASPNCLYCI